jgi:hypothetical protein
MGSHPRAVRHPPTSALSSEKEPLKNLLLRIRQPVVSPFLRMVSIGRPRP